MTHIKQGTICRQLAKGGHHFPKRLIGSAETALLAYDRTNSTEVSKPDKAYFIMKNTKNASSNLSVCQLFVSATSTQCSMCADMHVDVHCANHFKDCCKSCDHHDTQSDGAATS